jgi:hypothetical protein
MLVLKQLFTFLKVRCSIVVFKMPSLEGAQVRKIVCDFGLNKVMSHKLCSLSKISTMIGI